ncbi:MAG: DUF4199 domain-containing protein [Bacteroides sp.]
MTNSRNYLHKYAMQFGTYIGIYWILKFILFPFALTIPFLSLLFLALTLIIPFIGYYFVKTYRDKICRGAISFGHAFFFTVLMYMFASLLVAIAHYAYFEYIDQGYVIESYTQIWNTMLTDTPSMEVNRQIIEEMIETAKTLKPIDITMQLLSWDVIFGTILAFPTALVIMKKPTTNE